MRFEVNISKKYFFALVIIGLLFIGIVGVIAFSTNKPLTAADWTKDAAVIGHSVNEIDWSQPITKNITAAGFCIGTNCVTDWGSTGTGTGTGVGWAASGNNIYNSNTGNVGIGTNNPLVKFAVLGDVNMGAYSNLGEDSFPAFVTMAYGDTATDTCNGVTNAQYLSCLADEERTCVDINGNKKRTVTCVRATSGLTIGTNGISMMGGNVGIGTSTPSQKLTVAGNANVSGNLNVWGNVVLGNGWANPVNLTTGGVISATAISTLGINTISINAAGDAAISGNAAITGNLAVTGNTWGAHTDVATISTETTVGGGFGGTTTYWLKCGNGEFVCGVKTQAASMPTQISGIRCCKL